jgi:hypothetical protein
MPLYNPTDESLVDLLNANGCEVEVDQGESQCYFVRQIGGGGYMAKVEFGAGLAEFQNAVRAVHAANAHAAAPKATDEPAVDAS